MGQQQEQRRYLPNEVSRLCNLSRKQLRYYEKRGLISPVPRNAENNYRYYTQEHITQLFIIREYLMMGYSLDEIYALLYKSDISTLKQIINSRMERAHEEFLASMVQYEQNNKRFSLIMEAVIILDLKSSLLDAPNAIQNFSVMDFPEQMVLMLPCEGTSFDEQAYSQSNLSQLYITAEKYNLKVTGPLMYKFYRQVTADATEFLPGMKQMEMIFPIADIGVRSFHIRKMEGFKCVSAIHIGGYDDSLLETYRKLLRWTKAGGYRLTGDAVEQYLIGSEMTNNLRYRVTRVMLPIAP
jgi:DNA-binding transcriptional MerR regulator/effector-binding domain-containing protein